MIVHSRVTRGGQLTVACLGLVDPEEDGTTAWASRVTCPDCLAVIARPVTLGAAPTAPAVPPLPTDADAPPGVSRLDPADFAAVRAELGEALEAPTDDPAPAAAVAGPDAAPGNVTPLLDDWTGPRFCLRRVEVAPNVFASAELGCEHCGTSRAWAVMRGDEPGCSCQCHAARRFDNARGKTRKKSSTQG